WAPQTLEPLPRQAAATLAARSFAAALVSAGARRLEAAAGVAMHARAAPLAQRMALAAGQFAADALGEQVDDHRHDEERDAEEQDRALVAVAEGDEQPVR